MRLALTMAGVLAVTLAGTGCATKKYVAKVIAPVESRVGATENKNSEQDTQLAAHGKQIEEIGTDLTRSKERIDQRISDTDAKAVAAGQAAQQAGTRADGAQRSADGARTLAQQGIEKTDTLQKNVERTIDGVNRYQMLKTETVLFNLNQFKLTEESKAQLDEIAKMTSGQDRFMIEVQGYTDKTGPVQVNAVLSQQRAEEVSRYLVNEHKIPVRSISTLGSGYTAPVADDSTRDGRKMNRRVEIRLFVPEIASASKSLTAQN